MPPKENNIAHFVKRVSEHDDRKAFSSLFQIYYERLFYFSLSFVHSKDLAEEVVSDVFIKIWGKRAKLLDIQNIDTYLYIATKNQSINYIAKYGERQTTTSPEPNPNHLIEWFDPEKKLEYQELLRDLNIAVEHLPNQCKRIFKLIREDGLRYKEVAEILGISVRTVETQLFRAIKKLSAALEAHLVQRRPSKKKSKFISSS